jgi:hypothetical protein
MSRTLLVTATLFCVGSTTALADVLCYETELRTGSASTYHGYSQKPASPGAPGTSTVLAESASTTKYCFDAAGNVALAGRKNTSTQNYVDGPGNSPFEIFNPISEICEATGSLICP